MRRVIGWVVLAALVGGAGAWFVGWRLHQLEARGVVMPWEAP